MYTKEMQLQNNKPKNKKRVDKNKNHATPLQREFLDWIHHQDYKCMVCGKQNGIEWHHVKNRSTDKKNHTRLIPLCGIEHHRLGQLSPHGNPKAWRETFAYEFQMDFAKSIYDDFLSYKNV